VTASAPIAHIGLAVPDLDRAVRWYTTVLGFEPIGATVEVREGQGHAGAVARDVFGPGFQSFCQAHLAGANGVAIELFEFAQAPARTGLFHFCVVAPEIDRVAARIASSGGRLLTSRVWEIFAGEPYRTCYCEDPFGTVVELYSHSHERTYANRTAE
jgi:catechol 2,3-dioxygenase-like lactoylglutathione lyase family enzyme